MSEREIKSKGIVALVSCENEKIMCYANGEPIIVMNEKENVSNLILKVHEWKASQQIEKMKLVFFEKIDEEVMI